VTRGREADERAGEIELDIWLESLQTEIYFRHERVSPDENKAHPQSKNKTLISPHAWAAPPSTNDTTLVGMIRNVTRYQLRQVGSARHFGCCGCGLHAVCAYARVCTRA